MLHTHAHTHGHVSASRTKTTNAILASILLVLLAMAFWAIRATIPATLVTVPVPEVQSNRSSTTADRTEALFKFDEKTQALAALDSEQAFQTLLLSLVDNGPLAQRRIVVAALRNASPAVLPVLMTGLTNSDPGIRAGVAEVLGLRHEYSAIMALTLATRDPDAGVRLQAVIALDALDGWQALSRVAQLAVSESNDGVRQAAGTATGHMQDRIAQEIGVSSTQLRTVSVTGSNPPRIFAATTSDLYVRGETDWTLVSRLPDAPLALAAGENPPVLYLATVSSGLYTSRNGGETWEYLQFGLQTPTQLSVTAIVVDPRDSRRVYIALATEGLTPGVKESLGIMVSQDSGANWPTLPDAPHGALTTQLVIDPQWPGTLFGMSADTPWRYTLPSDAAPSP